jgi:hypothetical protein
MTDIQTQVTAAVANAKTTVEAEAKTVRQKAVAFVKAHIPTVVAAVGGYGLGATGLIGKVLKHFI